MSRREATAPADAPVAPLPFVVDALYYATNAAIAARLERRGYAGIRAAHGKVFENLAGGATLSELAARAQVTKQSMADLIAGLEREGYLERVPHPTDKRSQIVRTTKRGQRAVAAAEAILAELIAEWTEEVGAQDLAQAGKTLSRILGRTR